MPYFEFPRYRNTVLSKWMERPDWSLLAPFLNPAAAPSHAHSAAAAAAAANPPPTPDGRRESS
eukprot:6552083-Prymnesium_polylepis.1